MLQTVFQSWRYSPLFFWRDQTGSEIDLLIYDGRAPFPVEIKLSQSYHSDFAKSIERWLELNGNSAEKGEILYCGSQVLNSKKNVPAIPWFTL